MAIITLNNNSLSSVTSLPAGVGGKVLQVVNAESTTTVNLTSTTYTDSSLSASITPSSTSNKILVLINQEIAIHDTNDVIGGAVKILRDSTTIYGGVTAFQLYVQNTGGSVNNTQFYYPCNLNVLDSPSSTSALTYKTQIRSYQAGDTIVSQPDSMESSITLMEIAG